MKRAQLYGLCQGGARKRRSASITILGETMNIKYGRGRTEYGPGVNIELTGAEVATAIFAYLVAHGVHVNGPRTVTVNGELCESGGVYVDPNGFVISDGEKFSGRGADSG